MALTLAMSLDDSINLSIADDIYGISCCIFMLSMLNKGWVEGNLELDGAMVSTEPCDLKTNWEGDHILQTLYHPMLHCMSQK